MNTISIDGAIGDMQTKTDSVPIHEKIIGYIKEVIHPYLTRIYQSPEKPEEDPFSHMNELQRELASVLSYKKIETKKPHHVPEHIQREPMGYD